jgi:putative tricarboxylic transport membrane protein
MTGAKLRGMIPYTALLAGAAYLYHASDAFASAGKAGQLGPDFWPRAVLVLLMLVCAAELARIAFFTPQAAQAPAASAPHPDEEEMPRFPRLLAGGMALTVLYVPGIQYLGFFIATVLYLAAFMLVGRYRRIGIVAATSLLGSLAFVYVFMKIVYVSLPLGMGPFREVSIWILAALGIH